MHQFPFPRSYLNNSPCTDSRHQITPATCRSASLSLSLSTTLCPFQSICPVCRKLPLVYKQKPIHTSEHPSYERWGGTDYWKISAFVFFEGSTWLSDVAADTRVSSATTAVGSSDQDLGHLSACPLALAGPVPLSLRLKGVRNFCLAAACPHLRVHNNSGVRKITGGQTWHLPAARAVERVSSIINLICQAAILVPSALRVGHEPRTWQHSSSRAPPLILPDDKKMVTYLKTKDHSVSDVVCFYKKSSWCGCCSLLAFHRVKLRVRLLFRGKTDYMKSFLGIPWNFPRGPSHVLKVWLLLCCSPSKRMHMSGLQ